MQVPNDFEPKTNKTFLLTEDTEDSQEHNSDNLKLPYHGVVVSHLHKLCASLRISKRSYSQTVGWVQKLHEKMAANLYHLWELEEAGSC